MNSVVTFQLFQADALWNSLHWTWIELLCPALLRSVLMPERWNLKFAFSTFHLGLRLWNVYYSSLHGCPLHFTVPDSSSSYVIGIVIQNASPNVLSEFNRKCWERSEHNEGREQPEVRCQFMGDHGRESWLTQCLTLDEARLLGTFDWLVNSTKRSKESVNRHVSINKWHLLLDWYYYAFETHYYAWLTSHSSTLLIGSLRLWLVTTLVQPSASLTALVNELWTCVNDWTMNVRSHLTSKVNEKVSEWKLRRLEPSVQSEATAPD